MTDTEYLDEAARRYAKGKAPGGTLLHCEEIAETALAILKKSTSKWYYGSHR
jgi:hypothetical protein